MKKSGFTLIELLIVTVVIVTLMSLVFRLAGTGSDSKARAKTISRLQKLSNALSGYYAAFGSYPPVPLQGRSRDIYTRVDGSGSMGYGIQDTSAKPNKNLDKNQIEAACKAQPVAAGFPLNAAADHLEQRFFNAYNEVFGTSWTTIENYGGFKRNSIEWRENNVFMFGLMSFLLPRYQFMLDGEKNIYYDRLWNENNRLPYLMDGTRLDSWETAQKAFDMGKENYKKELGDGGRTKAMLEQLPSQAVCARWMPNFAGIVASIPFRTHTKFFGVETYDDDDDDLYESTGKWFIIGQSGSESGSKTMVNGLKTVLDGWNNDFYYYSPPPYQSYQLWSSGPDGRTFPPWAEKPAGKEKLINGWLADDIKVGDKGDK